MDNIPPGDYTLRAVARDPRRPSAEKTVLRNKIRIYNSPVGSCVVHAVNNGLVVDRNTMTIHFTSTGNPRPIGYLCNLDRSKRFVECKHYFSACAASYIMQVSIAIKKYGFRLLVCMMHPDTME